MQTPPSAQEVKAAAGKKGCEAIPYPDLRGEGQRAYQKQLAACKGFTCDSLTAANEIEAARYRAQTCREQRILMRTIFARAIGRVKEVLARVKPSDPLKPGLTTILKELEGSQRGHETAIDQVNAAFLKCEEKLKKLPR